MKSLVALFSTLVLLSCASVQAADPSNTDHTADVETIRKMILSGADAWNALDVDSAAATTAEDADFVNVLGEWIQGKTAIVESQRRILDRVMRKTYLKIEVLGVRFIRPDVAIAHGTVAMFRRTAEGQAGEALQKNLMSSVLVKNAEGRWLMTAFQNTKIEPPFGPPPKQ